MISALYSTLSGLYAAVFTWARGYVEQDQAAKVARHALARVWHLAAGAYETESGVWALVFEQAYSVLMGITGLADIGDQISATLSFPVPDDEILQDVTRLYTVAYMSAQHGQITLHERSMIGARMLLFDAVAEPTLDDRRALSILAAESPALRRALVATEAHACEGDLVCQSAAILRDDEVARGRTWCEAYCAMKGALWPGPSAR